ncbi:MAG: HU family DNA-binding protein [Paracoccaceae bacterium]
MIRKKELVEHVSARSGLKKSDVRNALHQAFDFIRENLLAGREIDCPPLGKIKVQVQRPNSPNPKLRFRVVPRKDLAELSDGATHAGGETTIRHPSLEAAEK